MEFMRPRTIEEMKAEFGADFERLTEAAVKQAVGNRLFFNTIKEISLGAAGISAVGIIGLAATSPVLMPSVGASFLAMSAAFMATSGVSKLAETVWANKEREHELKLISPGAKRTYISDQIKLEVNGNEHNNSPAMAGISGFKFADPAVWQSNRNKDQLKLG